jgi:hypothetical protein
MNNRKLPYRFFITSIFCLFGIILSAQHSDSSQIVPEKRDSFIQTALVQLQHFTTDTTILQLHLEEVSYEDYFRLKVRIIGAGLLVLPGKNRIYFLTSSSHDNPETGDITLAIDQPGRIYQNNGHVCGGIITFETGEIKKLKNSKQFFRHFVSDTDGEGWRRID